MEWLWTEVVAVVNMSEQEHMGGAGQKYQLQAVAAVLRQQEAKGKQGCEVNSQLHTVQVRGIQ